MTSRLSAEDQCARVFDKNGAQASRGRTDSLPDVQGRLHGCQVWHHRQGLGLPAPRDHYASRCDPPWTKETEILHKIDDAFKKETRQDLEFDQNPQPNGWEQDNATCKGQDAPEAKQLVYSALPDEAMGIMKLDDLDPTDHEFLVA